MAPSPTVWELVTNWPPSDVKTWAAVLRASSRTRLTRTAEMRERSLTLLGATCARLDDAMPAAGLGPSPAMSCTALADPGMATGHSSSVASLARPQR